MRLWSLHPSYLDTTGLTACWREGLLARHVLLGLTKGYTHHPQLIRFKQLPNPMVGIDTYLYYILQESKRRNYNYNKQKIKYHDTSLTMEITNQQLEYEYEHLKKKLETRNPTYYQQLLCIEVIQANPLFGVVQGGIASWEIRLK